jgi:hypothetical protein
VLEIDQPLVENVLRRSNKKTHKFNYLFEIKKRVNYITSLYVEDVSVAGAAKAVALEGVMWQHDVDMNLVWKKGRPQDVLVGQNLLRTIERFPDNIANSPGFAAMNVVTSAPDQILVRKVNDGFTAARTFVSDGSCEYMQYPEYDASVKLALDDFTNANPGGFDFDVDYD